VSVRRVVLTLMGLAAAALVLVTPFLTDDRYLLKVLIFVGVNVIVIAGLSLLFGHAGQISLGHAAFVGIPRGCSWRFQA